jgi:hypothetical protein
MANEPGTDRRVHINEGTLKKNLNPPPTTNRPPAPQSQAPKSPPPSPPPKRQGD